MVEKIDLGKKGKKKECLEEITEIVKDFIYCKSVGLMPFVHGLYIVSRDNINEYAVDIKISGYQK